MEEFISECTNVLQAEELTTTNGVDYFCEKMQVRLTGPGLNEAVAGQISRFTIESAYLDDPNIIIRLYKDPCNKEFRKGYVEQDGHVFNVRYLPFEMGRYQMVVIINSVCLPFFNIDVKDNCNYLYDLQKGLDDLLTEMVVRSRKIYELKKKEERLTIANKNLKRQLGGRQYRNGC